MPGILVFHSLCIRHFPDACRVPSFLVVDDLKLRPFYYACSLQNDAFLRLSCNSSRYHFVLLHIKHLCSDIDVNITLHVKVHPQVMIPSPKFPNTLIFAFAFLGGPVISDIVWYQLWFQSTYCIICIKLHTDIIYVILGSIYLWTGQ